MLASFSKLIYILTLSPFRAESGLWVNQKGVESERNHQNISKNKNENNERLVNKSAVDKHENLRNVMVDSSFTDTSNQGDGGNYWEHVCPYLKLLTEKNMQIIIESQPERQPRESPRQPVFPFGLAFAPLYLMVAIPLTLVSSIFLSISRTDTVVFLYGLSTLSLWICIGSSIAMFFLPMTSGFMLPFLLVSATTLLFGSTILLIGFFAGIFYLIFPPPVYPLGPNAVIIVTPPVPVLPPFGRTMTFGQNMGSKPKPTSAPKKTSALNSTPFINTDLNSFSDFVVRKFQTLQNNLLSL